MEQDGSTLSTSYTCNCTTVTDEAGNSRKSCVDGLGRLTGVWEAPSGLNYETDYGYDALDAAFPLWLYRSGYHICLESPGGP